MSHNRWEDQKMMAGFAARVSHDERKAAEPKCSCCKINDSEYGEGGLCEPCDFAEYVKSGGRLEDGDFGPHGKLD